MDSLRINPYEICVLQDIVPLQGPSSTRALSVVIQPKLVATTLGNKEGNKKSSVVPLVVQLCGKTNLVTRHQYLVCFGGAIAGLCVCVSTIP